MTFQKKPGGHVWCVPGTACVVQVRRGGVQVVVGTWGNGAVVVVGNG